MNGTNFEELTRTLIQTQIIAALKNAPEYVDALVESVMTGEVNEHGAKPTYSDLNKMPFLEWCVRDALRNATKKAVLESVRDLEPNIKESVQKALSSDEIVGVFCKRIINDLVDYKINVTVSPDE